ncbi:MAG: sodium/proton antiporter NhaB [Candidatus Sericytochromatia bacterium]
MIKTLFNSFMGNSPRWYKSLMIIFLLINPLLLIFLNKFTVGWIILVEFITTLALALKCYPLLSGGLLAIQLCFIGMVNVETIYKEVEHNLGVILLLMFMVAGIHFMKDFLVWLFKKILFSTKSKILLSIMFCFMGAFLSAWLDALTVMAVMIAVCSSFYEIYNEVSYKKRVPNLTSNLEINEVEDKRKKDGRDDLEQFKGFLRNLLMHGAIGTALGGVSTIVGEPQNLLIGQIMNWNFKDFFLFMAHVSIPTLISGLLTVFIVEKFSLFGYGYKLPERVLNVLKSSDEEEKNNMTKEDYFRIIIQGIGAIWLIIALALHLAEVGLIGLSVIILLTTFTGKNNEHIIGKSFEEAMPFTSLLVIFFVIVAMIQENNLFEPIITKAFSFQGEQQIFAFFAASGILSAISDNVFVATIYIQEVSKAFQNGIIDLKQFENLAIAINIGTNIPSIATPNGQAALLFLLTSGISSKIRLSYLTMMKLSLPYTIILTLTSLIFLNYNWLNYIPNNHSKVEINNHLKAH